MDYAEEMWEGGGWGCAPPTGYSSLGKGTASGCVPIP